jgi:integrase
LTGSQVKAASPGKYADGGGLWLHVREDGGGQWFLRVSIHGRRREMGLGSITHISLKEARQAAELARNLARQGTDPIRERQRQSREATRNLHCLRDVALDAFESRKAELKDDGKAGRWLSPLVHHVFPKLGSVPIADIDQIDVRDVLRPIWQEKADTARKARNRLAICLRHAAALDFDVDVQATIKAQALLGKQKQMAQHIPAWSWKEVPGFYQSLADATITRLALRLLILTAVRSGPLRFMRYEHLDGAIWTIPGAMMKGRKGATVEFRVPLSKAALATIEAAKPFEREGFVFPSVRKGVISDATMSRPMERRQMTARPHGFRSTFGTGSPKPRTRPSRSPRHAYSTPSVGQLNVLIGGATSSNSVVW